MEVSGSMGSDVTWGLGSGNQAVKAGVCAPWAFRAFFFFLMLSG